MKSRSAIIGFGLLIIVTAAVVKTGGQPPSTPASATADATHHVAVIDLVRIFNECVQIEDLNDMIRQQTADFTKEAKQRGEVIDRKQTALSAFNPGTDDYEVRRKELVRLNLESSVWLKVTESQIEQQKFDWTRVIYEAAMKSASQIAAQRGFDLVIQKYEFRPLDGERTVAALRRQIQERTVFWASPQIDITEQVIHKLDDDYRNSGARAKFRSTSQPTQAPAPGPAPSTGTRIRTR